MRLVLILCAAVGVWMALLALIHAVEGNWPLALVFLILTLLNANSAVVIYRRLP